jgi:putative membrane protein
MTPTEFARTVATVDLTEIKLGQLSQTHAADGSVKKFGAYMVKSHSEINGWLTKLAAKDGFAIPTSLDKKSAAPVAKLAALNGADFDRAYIPAMVAGHTKVLAMVKSFRATCSDPEFKKFAAKIEPIIAKHLARAEKIETAMQKAGQLPAADR